MTTVCLSGETSSTGFALLRSHWEYTARMPSMKSGHKKAVPSTVEFSPETSYTSLYPTIFNSNLFIIQGRSSPPLHLVCVTVGLWRHIFNHSKWWWLGFKNQLTALSTRSSHAPLAVFYWALLHFTFAWSLYCLCDSNTHVLTLGYYLWLPLPWLSEPLSHCWEDASCKLENSAGLSHRHTHKHANTIRCTQKHTRI